MVLTTKDIDYYERLLVSRKAPLEVIRASYRTLMQKLKHHPDLGGDTATAALINEAYAVLCHTDRRAQYDAYLDALQFVGEGIDFASRQPDRDEPNPVRADPHSECVFCRTKHDHGRSMAEDATCVDCSSPLFMTGNRRLELEGQRAVARIDKDQAITFYTQWRPAFRFTGRTENISLNGMRFTTEANMAQGQYIKIVSRFAEAIAQVSNITVRRRGLRSSNVAGVSFVTLRFCQSTGGFLSERV
jgi:curved DNA-binding protein CbpA